MDNKIPASVLDRLDLLSGEEPKKQKETPRKKEEVVKSVKKQPAKKKAAEKIVDTPSQVKPPVLEVVEKSTYETRHAKRTFYLSWETVEKLDKLSEETGISKSRLLTKALDYYMSVVEVKN